MSNNFPLDTFLVGPVVTEAKHHRIHKGEGYAAFHAISALANGASFDFLLATSSKFPHFRDFNVVANGAPFTVEVYEGTVTSNDGTTVPLFNCNRNSSNTAISTLTHTPTVSEVGTQIDDRLLPDSGGFFGNGGGGQIIGGAVLEWILKPNEKYLIRINNGSGAAEDVVCNFFFYESSA